VKVSRFAAVRIMAVDASDKPKLIVQPTVIVTRTALVHDPDGTASHLEELGNSYIYKLSLTN